MDVFLDPYQILCKNVDFGLRDIALSTLRLTAGCDLFVVTFLVNACHITTIQYVVNVFKHLLVNDLRVAE
jgi:hypothetical protein